MYEWLKALHIIAMVSWFAGLFYLPRLFVYHAMADDADIVGRERFKVMERKLYRGILVPSSLLTLAFGAWMLVLNWEFLRSQGWIHAKLALVFLLFAYQGMCGRFLRDFANDRNTRSHVFYRVFNEVPVVFLAAIVILVIVRPFGGP